MIRRYRDWKILRQLLVPLVGMGLASSLTVVVTAFVVLGDLRDQTIVELESAFALQSAVIELVGDFRDYLNLPSPAVLAEIEQTESEVEAALGALLAQLRTRPNRFWAPSELTPARGESRLSVIEDDVVKLAMLGGRVVAVRDAISTSLDSLEESEESINGAADRLHAVMKDLIGGYSEPSRIGVTFQDSVAQSRALGRLTTASQAYISETREYVLTPHDDPISDLTEIEEEIERNFAGLVAATASFALGASPVDEMSASLKELSIRSEATVQQRNELASARVDLESIATVFQNDLTELTRSFSNDADIAVRQGMIVLTITVVTTLVLTGFIHWWVSEGIAGPIGQLRHAAAELGTGNLNARSTLDRNDDVGELARAFNDMASNLSANISALNAAQEDLVRKERLAAVGQLTATVSHELRNPLGAMRSATEVIVKLADPEKPQMVRAIALLDRGQASCDRIISELLDFARVREIDRRPTDIDRWLGALLDDYRLPASITLVRNLQSGVRISIDRDRLERSIANVIDNACQAMSQDGDTDPGAETGVLTVTTRVSTDRIELSIADTGLGIPEANRAKIFEPLFSTKSIGVGLGLPMVKQIMEQHDGGVAFTSCAGDGTEVVLWLPPPDSDSDPGMGPNGDTV